MRIFWKIVFGALLPLLKRRQFTSQWLRMLFSQAYNVTVGMYSYGCFDSKRIAAGTVIGRYCSFSKTCYRFNGNHGLDFIALHPYLYNTKLGMVRKETIVRTRCVIEDDVWIGHAAIILPGVSRIGRGAVIAAGAVVTRDVPPYAIYAGNPARLVRYRFDDETIARIEQTQWWLKSKEELAELMRTTPELLYQPVDALRIR